MPEPAFLVDGVMEQKIIAHLCPKKPVRRIECNGRDVALEAIVERLDLHIQNLNNRYSPIMILIDRETREMSCDEIIVQLTSLLEMKGHHGQCVVGVVDRCIENWILADWENVKRTKAIAGKSMRGNSEGVQGKVMLKRLRPDDILYNEPTWGKELFLACDPRRIYAKSESFRRFVDQLQLPCHWLAAVSERCRAIYE